jgi:hypothetical protein
MAERELSSAMRRREEAKTKRSWWWDSQAARALELWVEMSFKSVCEREKRVSPAKPRRVFEKIEKVKWEKGFEIRPNIRISSDNCKSAWSFSYKSTTEGENWGVWKVNGEKGKETPFTYYVLSLHPFAQLRRRRKRPKWGVDEGLKSQLRKSQHTFEIWMAFW